MKRIKITFRTYDRMRDGYIGLCIACGAERDCCEPDAVEYDCVECGKKQVYGIEELLLLDKIEVVESVLKDNK